MQCDDEKCETCETISVPNEMRILEDVLLHNSEAGFAAVRQEMIRGDVFSAFLRNFPETILLPKKVNFDAPIDEALLADLRARASSLKETAIISSSNYRCFVAFLTPNQKRTHYHFSLYAPGSDEAPEIASTMRSFFRTLKIPFVDHLIFTTGTASFTCLENCLTAVRSRDSGRTIEESLKTAPSSQKLAELLTVLSR
jgi:hypothetical protein